MLSRLFGFLGPKPALIQGTDKLPEGESKIVALGDPMAGGTELVLCRLNGKLHALDRDCPHAKGGKLSDGPLQGGKFVMCPLHNYKFDPASGAEASGGCGAAKVYRAREKNGNTEVWAS